MAFPATPALCYVPEALLPFAKWWRDSELGGFEFKSHWELDKRSAPKRWV